jgi:SAM-dependent methyltransferase
MNGRARSAAHSLFDFGPLAGDYDRWYETPLGMAHDRAQKSDVRMLLGSAPPEGLLLDVGCGTGHWSRFFVSLGYAAIGIDISQEMIEGARTRATPQCLYGVADACELPFGNGCFDVVAAMATLEFVSDVSRVLDEMFRCVADAGVVLVGTLNRLARINRRRLATGSEPYVSGRLFTPGELRHRLERFGRVRMRASSPQVSGLGEHLGRRIARWLAGRRSTSGPFLVAEVTRNE